MSDMRAALRAAMTRAGIVDVDERAMIAAIAGGESEFQPQTEASYAHTPNSRIRQIFSSTRMMSDTQLNTLKANDVGFFDWVYGGRFGNVRGRTTAIPIEDVGRFNSRSRANISRSAM